MNTHCPDEQKLIAAIRTDRLTEEMRTHLKTCTRCREIAEITEQLGSFSESLPDPRLTGASSLYQQAKRTQGDPFSRVLLPIWIMQVLLAVATIVAAFAGLFSGSRVLFRLIQWFHSLPGLTDLTGMAALVVNIGTITGLAIAVLLPLTVMGMWFRDILHDRPTAPRAGC
ncbi:MAG: hypothetical protein GXO70_02915 [Acidobacteria bacterium]|nr:hypothetical protein [Acidobacteriota bacterium]